MKKGFLLLLFVTIFSSCNKDDIDSIDNIDFPLHGVWKLTELNITTAIDINGDSITNTNLQDETGIIDATLTFDTDNVGTIFYRSWIGFNTREEGGELVFSVISALSSDHAPEPFDYTVDGNGIIINTDITFNKGYTEFSQLEVINGELHVTIPNGFVVTDEFTHEESINQDLTYIFTKQ